MNKYLKDKIFLSAVDNMTEKEQYIKITVLDSDENEIDEIHGYVTNGGTLSINGDSAVRRTCTLNMIADKKYSNIMKTTNLLSINKRIKIEIGLANKTIYYPEEEIIWFPLGIFIIINPNISRSTSGISISLSLQDKMCLLNGSRGGVIPAYVTFDTVDEITPSGAIETKKIPIYQIIQELVNHFGNIPLDKIIIKDVDTVIISHGHKDHGGGLEAFLKQNDKVKIYISKYAFDNYYALFLKYAKFYVGLNQELKENKRIVLTDEMYHIDEEMTLISNITGDVLLPKGNSKSVY